MVRQRYHLITSTKIDDHQILESDWTRGTPRVVALEATFP